MSDRDLNTQRLFESALYGTPSYHGVRTPDGRILSELHGLRQDEDSRHDQMARIQGDLVETLRSANRGSSTLSRSDFDSRSAELLPAFREAAGRIQSLNQTQAELLRESHVLGRITSAGFTAVEEGLSGVRADLRGVSGDIVRMDDHVTGAIQEGTRTLHGPDLPQESLSTLVARSQSFFDALSAYSKGILNREAQRELRNLVDQRLRSQRAKAALRTYVDQKAEETVKNLREDDPDDDNRKWHSVKNDLRRKGYELGDVLDCPSYLIDSYMSPIAREHLSALDQISRKCPDPALRSFVQEAYGLLTMYRKAAQAPLPEAFLIDLTNSGLVADGVQHQVKQRSRTARQAGTDVDRNYNLMELLEQGDYAAGQRERIAKVAEKQLAVSSEGLAIDRAAMGQRDELIQTGNRQVLLGLARVMQEEEAAEINREVLEHLASIDRKVSRRSSNVDRIIENLTEANDHLVNLELLGEEFIEVMEFGFKTVNRTLVRGFSAVVQGLDQVAGEIALSRAVVVAQLKRIDRTIEISTTRIVKEVAYGNQQLEKLVALQEGSLLNLAQQRLKQGQVFLRGARTSDDFREAAEIFQKGIAEDPSFLENQFGLAVAMEGCEDLEEAKKRYRNVGRLADETRKEMSIEAWRRLSFLQEKEGDLPAAIDSMREALTKDPGSPTLRLALAKLLALAGIEEEAAGLLLSLIDENIETLFTLKLNPAFSDNLRSRVYKMHLARAGISRGGSNVALFLFDEFIVLGDKEESERLFEYLLRFSPRLLLKSELLEKLSTFELDLKNALLGGNSARSSEDWYASSLIAYRLGTADAEAVDLFQKALLNDLAFIRGSRDSVKQFVSQLAGRYSSDFIFFLTNIDPTLTWLNQD